MSFFSTIGTVVLKQPIFNLLMFFYIYLTGNDLGWAIILATILIMLILWPLQKKAMKSQASLQAMQPKLKELETKYKDDKQKMAEEFSKIYKSQGGNPFIGILIIFLQIPIFFTIYGIFRNAFSEQNLSLLYDFMPKPEVLNTMFLGVIDLTQKNYALIAIVALLQILQTTMMLKNQKQIKGGQKMMSYGMLGFIIVILFMLPSALSLYMMVYTIFSIFQQRVFKKQLQTYGEKRDTQESPKTS